MISEPIGSVNTKPSSASGRDTISANTMPSTVPSTAPIAGRDHRLGADHPPHLPRLMPTARSIPSSRVRSCTDSASVLTMPSSATITDSASSAKTSAEQPVDALVLLVLEVLDRLRLGGRERLQRLVLGAA